MIKRKSYIATRWETFRYNLLIPYGIRQIKKHGFWFVDIPRTSSTSIRIELAKKFGNVYGKSDVFEKGYKSIQILPNHLTSRVMRDYVGYKEWEKLFTFTIVRNPWDRVVSLYHYRLKSRLLRQDMGFDEYMHKLNNTKFGTEPFRFYGHYFGCSDFVTDDNGEIIVSFVAKYENRENDLKFIANKIGFPALGSLTVQKAAPESKHYSEYYNDETKGIVEEIYSKDIELFGYKFENKKK